MASRKAFGKGSGSAKATALSKVAARQFGRRPAPSGKVGGATAGLRGNAGGGKSG